MLVAAAIPLLVLSALQVKNRVLFGQWGTTSWLGMNCARIATSALTAEDLAALHERGDLSELAAIPPFSRLGRYPASYSLDLRYPDVAALARKVKATGMPNYNHEAYLKISRTYLDDALWIAVHRPGDALHGMAKAWYNYFKPQTEISHLGRNRERLRGYVALTEVVLYGKLPFGFRYRGEDRPVYLFSMVGIPILLVYAFYLCWRAPPREHPARALLIFLCFTTLYVALVGNSLEVWENQRFRFYTDPFLAVFLALALKREVFSRLPGGESR